MIVKIKKIVEDAIVPRKGSEHSAGYDLSSIEDVELVSMERRPIKTGITMEMSMGTYGRVAPRSGLAVKRGIDVLAGVVDSDYRGEIMVVLINFGSEPFLIKKGDKIAQIIFEYHASPTLMVVNDLSNSARGQDGFGSTDIVRPSINQDIKTLDDINKEMVSGLGIPKELLEE